MTWKEQHAKPIRILSRSARSGRKQFVVNSSSSNRRYIVTCARGKWMCSCLGWTIARKVTDKNGKFIMLPNGKYLTVRKPCRHIKSLTGRAA